MSRLFSLLCRSICKLFSIGTVESTIYRMSICIVCLMFRSLQNGHQLQWQCTGHDFQILFSLKSFDAFRFVWPDEVVYRKISRNFVLYEKLCEFENCRISVKISILITISRFYFIPYSHGQQQTNFSSNNLTHCFIFALKFF